MAIEPLVLAFIRYVSVSLFFLRLFTSRSLSLVAARFAFALAGWKVLGREQAKERESR